MLKKSVLLTRELSGNVVIIRELVFSHGKLMSADCCLLCLFALFHRTVKLPVKEVSSVTDYTHY